MTDRSNILVLGATGKVGGAVVNQLVDNEKSPLILFLHGGGWIYGNFDLHDRFCRRIARDTGAIVLYQFSMKMH